MAYTAFVLSEKSRAKLLQAFPPKFPDVICHHVTDTFGVPFHSGFVPAAAKILVVGRAEDASLECFLVSVNGTLRRGDGSLYHITHSLDRSQGRRPVDSNDLLKTNSWTPFTADECIEIETTPQLLK